jgi:nucleoside 2-deoxyribosyltransferase
MKAPIIYIAGPLFSDQDREMLLKIEQAFVKVGFPCFLPHRDVGDFAALRNELDEEYAKQYIFASDIKHVKLCPVLCALLDGADVDSGTAIEMGAAYTLGHPVFGLCTDDTRRSHTLNMMVTGVCSYGIYDSISELVSKVVLLLNSRRIHAI